MRIVSQVMAVVEFAMKPLFDIVMPLWEHEQEFLWDLVEF